MKNFYSKNIIVPTLSCNVVILKSKQVDYVYIYNKKFFFIGRFFSACWQLGVDAKTMALNFEAPKGPKTPIMKILYLKTSLGLNRTSEKLTNWVNSWDVYYFSKIKFKGKAYKINKLSRKNVKLSFGRSHITRLLIKSIFLKKRKKVKLKMFIYGVSASQLEYNKRIIVQVRPISMFTLRGLRLAKQVVHKKIGKKSSSINK